MNKDVIYIEPEDDITDIISKVKNAKTKIVALVPPKKAGVLRSAVNFKLIAKAAAQHDKTVVLISTDENLVKFARSVKMPVAKTLNSKPQLATDDEEEFGEDEADSDVIEESDEKEEKSDKDSDKKSAKSDKKDEKDDKSDKKSSKDDKKVVPVKTMDDDVDMEVDAEEEAEKEKEEGKKKSSKKVPNFKKYRWPIAIGSVLTIVLVLVLIWAFAIAPAAKIIVHVRTTDRNFSEKIQLTTNPDEENIDEGIFYMEEKTLEKTATADFEATGEEDQGTKASGTLTLKRTGDVPMYGDLSSLYGAALTIPTGAKFTYNNLVYVTTEAVTLRAPSKSDLLDWEEECDIKNTYLLCPLKTDAAITAAVKVEAVENGDKYNMSAVNSGWSTSISGVTPTSSTAMAGGTSKIIKIVSEDDLAAAEENLDVTGETDAKNEMAEEHKADFILIKGSFNVENGELSSSPALGEEVANDITPKVVKKTTYKIFAVSRDAIDQYIEKQVKESLGDNTQTVYTTGAGKDEETVVAFFESYKTTTAKLKSTVKTGPLVTPEMVSEKVLGQKVGQVRTMLTSINGVTDVEIDRSYFWVTSIPSDINKVEIEITVK